MTMLAFTMFLTVSPERIFASEPEKEIFKYNDLYLNGLGNEPELKQDANLNEVLNADEGTFTVRFKLTKNSNILSLLSFSNNKLANNYFALHYRSSGQVGIEFRDEDGNHIINKNATTARLSGNSWHTSTLTYNQNEYTVYGDGELLFKGTDEISKLKDFDLNTLRLGSLSRSSGDKLWTSEGLFESISYESIQTSEADILSSHQYTSRDIEEPLGEATEVFVSGDGSYNYRIPSLLTTSKGTVIAGIDKRNQHWSDWGDVDISIKRSEDHGVTWNERQDILDLQSNLVQPGNEHSAFYIDSALVQDRDTDRIFLLVDMFPESRGFFSINDDVNLFDGPFVETPLGKHLSLRHEDGTFYYVTEEGIVNDMNHEPTDMTVVMTSTTAPYKDLGDVIVDGERIGNIYHRYTGTPIRAMATAYLWLTYSDDDGKTWSSPTDITHSVKKDWMRFLGTGPGSGLQLQNGDIVFPVYHTNANGGPSQSAAVVISSDHGETWQISESVNDNRVSGNKTVHSETLNDNSMVTTESQLVQLKDGTVLMFSRNMTGKVLYSTSHDNARTWENTLTSLPINDVYVQLSVTLTEQNGKEYILLSNANGPGRSNGEMRVLEVQEDNSLKLLHSTSIQKGGFAYNVVLELADETFGVFYEHQGPAYDNNFGILFKKFSFDQLGQTDEIHYASRLEGNTLTIQSNKPFIQSHNVKLKYNNGKVVRGQYDEKNPKVISFTFEENVDTLEGFVDGYVEGVLGDSINLFNDAFVDHLISDVESILDLLNPTLQEKFKQIKLNYSQSDKDMLHLAQIVSELMELYDENLLTKIPTSAFEVTASAEAPLEIEGQKFGPISFAFDEDESTFWHTVNGINEDEYIVTFDFLKETRVDKLRVLPRQDNSLNSIIQEYEIYATVNDERLKISEGVWDLNHDMKEAIIEDPVTTKKLEFVITKSERGTAGAAEITLHGEVFDDIDISEVLELIEKIEKEDLSKYTDESVSSLRNVIAGIKQSLKDAYKTQDHVNGYIKDINDSYNSLRLKNDGSIDKEVLIDLVQRVKNMDLSKYTQLTSNNLLTAISKAETALLNESITQNDINELVSLIELMLTELETISDIPKEEADDHDSNDDSNPAEDTHKKEDPKTGIMNNSLFYMTILAVSLSSIIFMKRKRKS